VVSIEAFQKWLNAYGSAWQARDPTAATRIFTPDAQYHWTPFGPPQHGHDAIAAAWGQATSRQHGVNFRYTIWFVSGSRGVAHWHTSFTRISTGVSVEIDGVLLAEFDTAGLCRLFREWWHSTEGG
jgi:ketosteroid isomerase-like protein